MRARREAFGLCFYGSGSSGHQKGDASVELGRSAVWRSPWLIAAVTVWCVFCWQAATVRFNYEGNWTALFCTADRARLPAGIAESTYRFPGSNGYDGQAYRLVAHDPWLRRGLYHYIDDPALRYRRILLPAAAWLVAQSRVVSTDQAYILVVLGCVFLGTASLARFLADRGIAAAWGAVFPLIPACLISIDRMTVDIALVTLLAVLLAHWDSAGTWHRASLLALCPLVRDLGFLFIAAALLCCLYQGRRRDALCCAAAAAPAALWWYWVRITLSGLKAGGISSELPVWLTAAGGGGLAKAFLHPNAYELPGWVAAITQMLDAVALAGLVLAVVLAIRWIPAHAAQVDAWILACFIAAFFFVDRQGFYRDVYSYSRAYTPMLALVALWAGLQGGRIGLLPLAAVVLRVAWQLGRQVTGIVDAILS
jgi:hypothetical protein